jgi:hypothetical protein
MLQRSLLYTSFFVGWVERSETHRIWQNGGFRFALPTLRKTTTIFLKIKYLKSYV